MNKVITSVRTVIGVEHVFRVNSKCPITNVKISSICLYDKWVYRVYDENDDLISEIVNIPCFVVYGDLQPEKKDAIG